MTKPRDIDEQIRNLYRRLEPTVDAEDLYASLRREAVRRKRRATVGRNVRTLATVCLALVLVAVVGAGIFRAVAQLREGTHILYITNDTAGMSPGSTGSATQTTVTEKTAISQAVTTTLGMTAATTPDGLPLISVSPPVYDPTSGRVIFFGGWSETTYANDTWAYDSAANTWTNLHPAGSVPSPRYAQAMAYDPVSGRMIMFGGFFNRNDTWAYDPTANIWTELRPAGDLPAARNGSVMVYDPTSGRMILFGGWVEDSQRQSLGDTWAYDPTANTWTELHLTGSVPTPRDAYSLVYDSVSGRMILFGGHAYVAGAETYYNDLWAYDPAADTWTELHPGGNRPSPRVTRAAYDPNSGSMIVFGGNHGPNASSTLYDMWTYDLAANTWTELHPVGGLPSAAPGEMIYDRAGGRVIMFGAFDATAEYNDIWTYDLTANTWTELHPTLSVP